MTNQQRLDRLMAAKALIREVEFSYPEGSSIRHSLFRVVVNNFNHGTTLDAVRMQLLEAIEKEERNYIADPDSRRFEDDGGNDGTGD